MEQLSLFDDNLEDFSNLKPIESNDWKWYFKDYPQKNGLKVFSCFAGGGGVNYGI